jgi:hypothetical protein
MLADTTYGLRNSLREQGIVFCYSGYMTEDVLSGIGDAIKRKLAIDDADTRTARSVFSVFVEQVQNVIRYSAEREPAGRGDEETELRYGVLTVGKKDGLFFVTCGNLIERSDVSRLGDSLRDIQKMDRSDLKSLYKQTLRGKVPEGSKGAGVGFIDIALKASEGIEFDFMEVDDAYSFFTLKAFI